MDIIWIRKFKTFLIYMRVNPFIGIMLIMEAKVQSMMEHGQINKFPQRLTLKQIQEKNII